VKIVDRPSDINGAVKQIAESAESLSKTRGQANRRERGVAVQDCAEHAATSRVRGSNRQR